MSSPAPSSRDRVALIVLALGALAIVLAAAPYKSFDLDRYFVPKELGLHVCAGVAAFLLLRGARQLTLSVTDALLVAFLAESIVSAAFAANGWAAQRAVAISVSGALVFWAAAALRRAGRARALLVVVAASVVVAAATSLAQAYGVQSEFFSLNRAPGGTFGNRNFIAHYAAIGTPVVVLTALTAPPGLGSLFGGGAMAILTAVLVLSRSRAAWLAVIVLGVIAGGLALLTRGHWRGPRTGRRMIVLAGTAAAGAAAAVLLPNRLEWRSDSPYLESAQSLVNYKEGSGRGRLVQYGNSLRMLRAHPLLGVGPGNWPVAYPKYASRNDPSLSQDDGMTSNPWPSSDWVAYASERGVIGWGLIVAAILALVARALGDLRRGSAQDAERVLTNIALVGTAAATVVVGTFDAVLLLAAPAFLFWALAGALAPPVPRGTSVSGGVRALVPAAVVVLVAIATVRSAASFAAMARYSTSSRLSALELAATFDPGSYRIRLRLAQAQLSRGDCAHARVEARAARGLFPNAAEPRRILSACGARS